MILSRILRTRSPARALAAVTSYCLVAGRTSTEAFSVVATPSFFARPRHRSTTVAPSLSSSLCLRMSSSSSPAPRVLVPIADGSEEIETCCITDTLTRFGAEVTTASVMPGGRLACTMSRGITVVADVGIDEAASKEWDMVALPGGMPGAEHLRDSAPLKVLLTATKASGTVAAVCASPAVVLSSHGLLPAGSTCYPAAVFRDVLNGPSDEKVVVQGNVISSQGPGTSLLFALRLGEELFGKEKADEIAKEMLVER